ncbi:MAG TPA: redoxin family protein [Lacipirellulaceae bacterium]|nr:redoxin family protein [Lacipirellulaceae bacterium]
MQPAGGNILSTAPVRLELSGRASVVLVYPGPASRLDDRAQEFLGELDLPEPFIMALDPDFEFTNAWGLRWNEPNETAYPSTFIVDQRRRIQYRKVSQTHGDRSEVKEVLAALAAE